MPARRWLTTSAVVYVAGLSLHLADHVRRGVDVLTGPVLIAGYISTVAGVVTVALVFARHRMAALAAALIGLPVAVGVAIVHIPPDWGAFSDPFIGSSGTGVTGFSWGVVFLEIVGALGLGIFGLAALKPRPATSS